MPNTFRWTTRHEAFAKHLFNSITPEEAVFILNKTIKPFDPIGHVKTEV